jgi:hypothetical protein
MILPSHDSVAVGRSRFPILNHLSSKVLPSSEVLLTKEDLTTDDQLPNPQPASGTPGTALGRLWDGSKIVIINKDGPLDGGTAPDPQVGGATFHP